MIDLTTRKETILDSNCAHRRNDDGDELRLARDSRWRTAAPSGVATEEIGEGDHGGLNGVLGDVSG